MSNPPSISPSEPVTAPYGTWTSPISAALVAAAGVRLSSVVVDGDDLYWIEARPAEAGRSALVRRSAGGRVADVTPAHVNVRTRVNEYGGGAYAVARGTIVYSNFVDQRLYLAHPHRAHEALTPADLAAERPGTAGGLEAPRWHFADCELDLPRRRLIAVREDHGSGSEAVTTLVSVPLVGPPSAGEVVAEGFDFYSTPRLSPDGSMLAWLAWNHPRMPWDGTELWLGDVTPQGGLSNVRRVAGGNDESIYQPGWSPGGVLYFASDRTGWWQLYRLDVDGGGVPHGQPILRSPRPGTEFGRPQWVFGTSVWASAGASRLAVTYTSAGRWHLGVVDCKGGTLTDVASQLEPGEWVAATATHAVLVAGSATEADALVRVNLSTGATELVLASSTVSLPPGHLSVPEALDYPTLDGATSHLFYYAPRNQGFRAPSDERPPLIVISHGGPTAATHARLRLEIQFWTSRGFAVADVNYGGSSGYGRAYRRRLEGQWGIVDVWDCVNAATFLAAAGRVDGRRSIIRGGSAGGYTTLCALAFHPGVFSAGASYYGVSDAEALARDTHKFESRYLDRLIGPYPEAREVYRARSPIHSVDRFSCPLIVFQGLEDKVVPPSQSEMIVEAVRAKGLAVEYLTFAGEQHGFRKAETIVRCLEEELRFYRRVFVLPHTPGGGN